MKPIQHTDLYEAALDAQELAERMIARFLQAEYFTHQRGTSMTKNEIALRIQVNTGIQLKQALEAINTTLEAMKDAISQGDRVELRGFGIFTPKLQAERKGRNPNTGESVIIREHHTVKFKPGKAFKEKLQRI